MPKYSPEVSADLDDALASCVPSADLRPALTRALPQAVNAGALPDVRLHQVELTPGMWTGVDLWRERFAELERHAAITRGDVIDVFSDPTRSQTDRLVVSYVWGTGKNGYGPHRLNEILASETEKPLHAAAEALRNGADSDAIAAAGEAYRLLAGAIPGFGPAFYSKFLYFTDTAVGRGTALILDAVLAARMRDIAAGLGRERGVVDADATAEWLWRGPRWSRYRYETYLRYMHSTAARLGWPADLVELAMFCSGGDHWSRVVAATRE